MPAAFNIPYQAKSGRNARFTVGDTILAFGKWSATAEATDVEIRNFELVAPGFSYGIAAMVSMTYTTEGSWNFLTNLAAAPPNFTPGYSIDNVKLWLEKNGQKWTVPESRVLQGTMNTEMDQFISWSSNCKASGSFLYPGDIAALPANF